MRKFFALFFVCSVLCFPSCKKTQVDNETTSSTDFALLTQEFMQILPAINERATPKPGLGRSAGTTFIVCPADSLTGDTTHDAAGKYTDTTNLPVLWMQYANCPGTDGKTRNGTIKISFTKKYNIVGCVATVTLSNYAVNGVSCKGTITVTRNSSNSFTYNVTDGSLSGSNWTTKFSCSAIATLFDNGTSAANDDYLQLLGNANGTNRENRKYDVTISESLKKRVNCAWISQGTASITPAELHTRIVDFGNETCDDIASFMIDTQTFTLHMSK